MATTMKIVTADMERSSEIIPEKNTFDVDDVTYDITAWRKNWPSIFMFKWNYHIFRDTGRSFQPTIT